jgi:cytochrome c biogenesis factor
MWGGLHEASLIIIVFFFSFFVFIFVSLSTGHATIAKVEAAEASISILLLHQSLIVKASNPFFK